MVPPEHRRWMDNRVVGKNLRISNEFFVGVEEFLEFASQLDVFKHKGKFECPCLKCKCKKSLQPDEVRTHLYEKGFMHDYYYWHNHGEKVKHPDELAPNDVDIHRYCNPSSEQTALDVAGASSFKRYNQSAEFNEMLATAEAPLWDGCENYTVLSVALELLSIQSDQDFSVASMDKIIKLMTRTLPANHRMPMNLY